MFLLLVDGRRDEPPSLAPGTSRKDVRKHKEKPRENLPLAAMRARAKAGSPTPHCMRIRAAYCRSQLMALLAELSEHAY